MFVLLYMFVFMFSDMCFCRVVSMSFSVFLCVCDPSMVCGNEYALHNLFKDKFSVMALVQSKRFIR